MANFKMVQEFDEKAYFLPLPGFGYEVVVKRSQLIDDTSKLGKALIKYYGENIQYEGETKSLMEKVASGDTDGGVDLTPTGLTSTQAKDAIYKAHSIGSSASEIDGLVKSKQELMYFSDLISSQNNSKANYEDTSSSLFIENWNSLSAWSNNTNVQINNNKLYATGTAGASSGINHGISLASNETLRFVCKLSFLTGLSSGGVCIGVSTDATDAVPQSAMGSAYGIYFNNSTMKQVINGVQTDLANALTRTFGEYIITVIVDLVNISVVATNIADDTVEYAMKYPRSGLSINNIYIFNSDARGLAGCSVGVLGMRKGLQTIYPRTNIESINKTVHWTSKDLNNFKIYLPKGYDSRKSYPCIIGFHGLGSNEQFWFTNGNMRNVQAKFVSEGYIFLACSYANSSGTWGNFLGTKAYYQGYKYLIENYSISSVGFYANSMGGIESLNTLVSEQIPCSVWVSTSASTNLKNIYETSMFTAGVKSAYQIATDGSDYDSKTIGRDPMLEDAYKFRGIPMLFISATDDAAVNTANNTDVFLSKISKFTLDAQKITVPTGGHSFNNAPYLDNMVSFFNKYLKNKY